MVEVTAFRWATYDRPFWVNPNTKDGRFQRAGNDPTQYWCLHPLGPWAELLRSGTVAGGVDLSKIRQRVWAARFTFDDAELLRVSFDWAYSSGEIEPHDLVSDHLAECQDFADRVRQTFRALEVPSAALPGSMNLVVFGPCAASPYQLPPIDPDIDVPTSVVAEDGCPPADLLAYVRFRGQPHAELEAWRSGAPYVTPPPIGVPPARPLF